jgi:hypothetical protein
MKFLKGNVEVEPNKNWLFLDDNEDLLVVHKVQGTIYKFFKTKEKGFMIRLPNGFTLPIPNVQECVDSLVE